MSEMRHTLYLILFLSSILLILNVYVNFSKSTDQLKNIIPKFGEIIVPELGKQQEKKHTNKLLMQDGSYLATVSSRPSYCLPIPTKSSVINNVSLLDCSQPYVIIKDGGRLGNRICQYSALWILRKYFGIRVAIQQDTMRVLSGVFEPFHIPNNNDYSKCFTPGLENVHYNNLYRDLFNNLTQTEKPNSGSSSKMKILQRSHYISDNPCPIDIMWLYREELRKELVIKSSLLKKAKTKINETFRDIGIPRENVTLVTVHIRRGDYKWFLRVFYGADLITLQYFERAFDFYRKKYENPIFLVTSDDPKWCMENFLSKDVKVAASSDATIDFVILSLGDHHIRSVGTFSFTSALLGHGDVVYPVNYSRRVTELTRDLNCATECKTLLPMNVLQNSTSKNIDSNSKIT